MKMYEGVEMWLHAFVTLALDGGELLSLHPGCCTPEEKGAVTQWIEGWVGPIADMDAVAKKK
jgi:hypothetical protein